MSLTAEQRAEINRNNAKASTGPKTAEGKTRSRMNALMHGLRAEALAMPGEDPAIAALRSQIWNDFYQPQSPAAQHQVNECVRATLFSDRVATFQATTSETQYVRRTGVRNAGAQEFVEEQLGRLKEETLDAIATIKRDFYGCGWLIGFWNRLANELAQAGILQPRDVETGYYLLGRRNVNAQEFMRFARSLHPSQPLDPAVTDLAGARARLAPIIAAELAAVRVTMTQIDDSDEVRELAAIAASCLIPDDPATARLLLRYQAEARTSFQRAWKTLETTLKRDAERWQAEDAVVESPNEAESSADDGSPNEAESSADDGSPNEASAVAVGSPNEADVVVATARKPSVPRAQGDPTVCDERGLPTNMVNMCMVPAS